MHVKVGEEEGTEVRGAPAADTVQTADHGRWCRVEEGIWEAEEAVGGARRNSVSSLYL